MTMYIIGAVTASLLVFDEDDQAARAAYAQLVRGEFQTDNWRDTIFRALTIGDRRE